MNTIGCRFQKSEFQRQALVTVQHGNKVNGITYDNDLESTMDELVNELL